MKNKIKEQLTQIFRTVFEDNTIELFDEMNSRDVENWDSLAHLIMLKRVESEFNITFKIKEMATIQNVGNLMKVIEEKLENL